MSKNFGLPEQYIKDLMSGDREDAPMDEGLIKQIIRSNRRTLALQIAPDGSLIVRAPQKISEANIVTFVQKKNKMDTASPEIGARVLSALSQTGVCRRRRIFVFG